MALEQAPSFALCEKGDPDASKWKHQTHDQRIQHHQPKVVRPATGAADRLRTARRQQLPHASQHLQQLRRAGLVTPQRSGKRVVYRLADQVEAEIVGLLGSLRHVAEHAVASMERVIGVYFRARDQLEPVTATELVTRLREGSVVLIDVRPEDEYGLGHLPGALNIPLRQLEQRLSEISRDHEIVAYCRGPYCVLSFEAVATLRARGYQVRRLEDGYPEWRAARLPVEIGAASAENARP
jgi:rhodanese-related sulfurtransferase